MANWWKKLFSRNQKPAEPSPPTAPSPPVAPSSQAPRWMTADDPGNPFGVPLLNLMMLQGYLSVSQEPHAAARSTSWHGSTGAELDGGSVASLPPIACELRYPCAHLLPDGLLYAPETMEEKWVLALRDGRVLAARSWTGSVEAVLDARRDGDTLVLERLRVSENSGLSLFGPTVETVDWLVRSHALGERIPLPVNDVGAAMLEQTPLLGFGPFGKTLFCAARNWRPPPVKRRLRSDGEVIVATRKGDVPALERAVKAGADLNAPGRFGGGTALHEAIVRRDAALFEAILKLGADPAVPADGETTTLSVAVVHKAPMPIFESLAKCAVDPAEANELGFTALHAAAEVNYPEIIPWLLRYGLSLEARTKKGYTPLHIAAGLGHREAAESLLAAGADINATSDNGTPLDVARAEKKPALVELLSEVMRKQAKA